MSYCTNCGDPLSSDNFEFCNWFCEDTYITELNLELYCPHNYGPGEYCEICDIDYDDGTIDTGG